MSGWCWEWWVRWLLTVLLRLGWAGTGGCGAPAHGWLACCLPACSTSAGFDGGRLMLLQSSFPNKLLAQV